MEAVTAAHDAMVQMIDTSIIRVHQHGACTSDNGDQDIGRSRGGLTSQIHALVDANGLPIRVGLTPGEAHDNRLFSVLLGNLGLRQCCSRTEATMLIGSGRWSISRVPGRTSRRNETARNRSVSAPFSIGREIEWSVSSIGSSSARVSQPVTTSSRPITWPLSNSHPYGSGYGLMSPRPRS